MEKLEKLMSRDIDGQKLENFWSLTSFFFFLKEKGRKIARHYGQIFPKRVEKGDSLPLKNL